LAELFSAPSASPSTRISNAGGCFENFIGMRLEQHARLLRGGAFVPGDFQLAARDLRLIPLSG